MVKKRDEIDDLIAQAEGEFSDSDIDALIAEDSAQPEPTLAQQEPEKPTAWYDVPKKVSETVSTAGKKIEREGELAGQGKQSGLTGGLWSMVHAGSGALRAVGDVVSPVFTNPVSKAIIGGIGEGLKGQMHTPKFKEGTKIVENTPNKTIERTIESGKKYIEENPEVANRLGSVVDVGSLAVPELKAGSMLAKGAKKPIGEGLKGLGEKAVSITLKPKERDFNAGFKVENVYKYDLDGPLDKTIKKTQDKITELSTELKSRIQQGADEGARVNAFDLIDQTINKVKGEGIKNLNKNKAINQLNALKEEISMTNPDGILDLADAQDFKRSVGAEGSWYESKWGRQVDPDANAKQKAYSELYHSIKNDIELKAPEGIKEINKQLSELIPIENTALKRLYVSQRNEMIPLKDMIGLATAAATGPKGWLLYGANKALNSPVTGSGAYRLGESLLGGRKRPDAIPAVAKKELAEPVPTIENFETPTYLRKGRATLPEQPLESKWKEPTYQETPTSAKMMQLLEDFNKRKSESTPIEGIDYMSRDAAGDLAQQVTEKSKLPVALPLSTNLISNDIKKEVIKFNKEKTPGPFENKGSGFINSIKEDVTIESFNKWFDSLAPEEKTEFLKRIGKTYPEKENRLLSSVELAEKRVPSSLMTQKELSLSLPFKSKQKVKLAQPITKPEDYLIGKR